MFSFKIHTVHILNHFTSFSPFFFFLKQVSNRFYFTFGVDPEAIKNGLRIRNVVPGTEEEAQKVLERIDAETS